MPVTKKAYELVANAMRDSRAMSREERNLKRQTVRRLCHEFGLDNPRFNAERFIVSCYGPGVNEYYDADQLCSELGL